jgi:hypothetical protein
MEESKIIKLDSGILDLTTAAQHFKEYSCYTKEPVGSKLWFKFWEEERNRCLNGYSNGRYSISGYFYNYLNYSPILQTEVKTVNLDGQNQADRIKDFPSIWDGDFEFFDYIDTAEKKGEHALLLGSRGKGKSLKAASMCVRNYHHIKESKSYCFAAGEGYLLEDGIISKAWDTMNFIDQNTPWAKRRQVNNDSLHRRASIKQTNAEGIEIEAGYKSEIIGVTVGDNIDKLRGKRGKLIILEEFGNFPRGKRGWNILRPSMESGKNTFGLILALGTGGTEGSNFEAMEEIFYKPKGYKVHAVTNKWDEGMENTECAFFFPAWKNFEGAMDKYGNSDKVLALQYIEEDRKAVSLGNDPHALTRRKAEIPNTPREAMMKITGSKFPVADLQEHLAYVEGNPHKYKQADYIGKFTLDADGAVQWKPDDSLTPIYDFPHKDNRNMPGATIIWEQPYTNNKGVTPYGMYIAGLDSYDHDESQTTSLGSCWVMNTLTNRLVAEDTGRPSSEVWYERVRRLLLYYNAVCNPENHNKGILDYFERKNSFHLFCDPLRIITDINQTTRLSRKKGTAPNDKINSFGRTLIAEWLLERAEGQEPEGNLLNLHKIRSIPLLKELILWNSDGNYDRVSALGMLMLLKKDMLKLNLELESPTKTLAQDPFWSRNYKKTL